MSFDAALQAAIAGEDAAVYGYGIVAARAENRRSRALRALAAHREARDRLAAAAAVEGVSAPAPALAYTLPFAVNGANEAAQLAADLENSLVPLYADLAAAASGPLRQAAVNQARDCADRAIRWGAAPQAFPQ
jgi:hypothetical protein